MREIGRKERIFRRARQDTTRWGVRRALQNDFPDSALAALLMGLLPMKAGASAPRHPPANGAACGPAGEAIAGLTLLWFGGVGRRRRNSGATVSAGV